MDTLTQKLDSMIRHLRRQKAKVALAESCSGGRLSAEITQIPGVSDIFLGAVVSYSNQAKEDILGVLRDTLIKNGAVSNAVALEMARGARKILHSDWAIAITGIAGPDGGTELKPVGTVCFAVVGPGVEFTEKKYFSGSRTQIQLQSVEQSVDYLIHFLGV